MYPRAEDKYDGDTVAPAVITKGRQEGGKIGTMK